MWQLRLLGQVIPAFGALARDFIESDVEDARLCQDANDCYSDIVSLGLALSVSRREWAAGIDDKDLTKLLQALESRIPTRRNPFGFFKQKPAQFTQGQAEEFPKLEQLCRSIELKGLGGLEECSALLDQSAKHQKIYLALLGSDVRLFHAKEQQNGDKRAKFLVRVKRAAAHLLDVYCRDPHSGQDIEDLSLSQHPSHGMKELADKVYGLLDHHWKCECSHRGARPTGSRQARLSLIRYRQLADQIASKAIAQQAHLSVNFEILLPVCRDIVEWKVTNFEVEKSRSKETCDDFRKPVDKDICPWLLQSKRFRVDFVAENEKLWHLKPELLDGVNQHTTMESLHQLLGDDAETSQIAKYTSRDQLLLCYGLANSMLYLYPGSWLQTAWSSNMVYFIRRVSDSTSTLLTFPYLAVEIQKPHADAQNVDHMQYHAHPVILALGIMFLEIATGVRFKRSPGLTSCEQWNTDGPEAFQLLKDLERQGRHSRSKRLPTALRDVIRACLILKPPSDFPSKTLLEEGPIRHYILSCIVHPLATELKVRHNVRLEELHDKLAPEVDLDGPDNFVRKGITRVPSTPISPVSHSNEIGRLVREDSLKPETCFSGGAEESIDAAKKSSALKWFQWHNEALCRIDTLRNPRLSGDKRIKIAILDSGIELSQDNQDIYNNTSEIKYQSWVDEEDEWKDQVGHGTHLATLLRKIAPNSLIHVARVYKKKPTMKKSAACISEAIRHAVDKWKVDIIVMSFGFEEEEETLSESINYAAHNNVLMFAAASNDGKNRPDGVAWPARDMNVICVHSAEGYGTPSTFTPSPRDNQKIMVLGECVRSAWPQHLKSPGDHKHMSGTSCAAPIAAGIAAILLDYSKGFLEVDKWNKLHRVDFMRRMFEKMKDPGLQAGYWWVQHWKLFDDKRSEAWIQDEIRSVLYNY
ncbi:hypothetical protein AUP68_17283 [Ilyonectria robusta]